MDIIEHSRAGHTGNLEEGEFVPFGNLEITWDLPRHIFSLELLKSDDEEIERLRMFEKELVDVKTRHNASDVA